jgi:hypothetical protein
MKRSSLFNIAFALSLLPAASAFAQAEKSAKEPQPTVKADGCKNCGSLVTSPPNICPQWPIDYSDNGYIYYAERYDPDCDHIYEAYLDGLFSFPESCLDPSNNCQEVPVEQNAAVPTRRYTGEAPAPMFNTPHEYAGHTKLYDVNHDPVANMPVKVGALHAQRIPVQTLPSAPPVFFPLIVKFLVKEVPHFVSINKVMLSKPVDFGRNEYHKTIYFGHEVAPQAKFVELTTGVQAIDAYGRDGKPDVTYYAYRLNLADTLGKESGRDVQAVVFLKR